MEPTADVDEAEGGDDMTEYEAALERLRAAYPTIEDEYLEVLADAEVNPIEPF